MANSNFAANIRFHPVDYAVLVLVLIISTAIGVFHACSGGKQRTAKEYLVGNRQMGVLPVTMSLLASFLSGVGLLGLPAEIYMYGYYLFWIWVGMWIAMPASAYLYLPVFYELKVTSANEYIEKRFNRKLRLCGSFLFILHMTAYMAFVTYAPALALSHVTGIHLWGCVVAIGVVGTFYTAIGGIKAVMWTDVFQIAIMVISIFVIIIKGIIDMEGLGEIFRRNVEGKRMDRLSFGLDPTERYTFWAIVITGFVVWTGRYGTDQTQVQRYLSSPTLSHAQRSIWWNLPGLFIVNFIMTFPGILIYAKYWKCDPIAAGRVESPDQVFPIYVMDTVSSLYGLPGLFVAGLFSGSLSTVSSGLNSLAAVTLQDIVRGFKRWENLSEESAAKVSKVIATSYGVICIALVGLASNVANMSQAFNYNVSIFSGNAFGIFTVGLFLPWVSTKGMTVGLGVGFALALWLGIGAQLNRTVFVKPPVSLEDCSPWINSTLVEAMNESLYFNVTEEIPYAESLKMEPKEEVFALYRISFLWVPPLIFTTVVIVSAAAGFIFDQQPVRGVDARLISPVVRYILKRFFNIHLKVHNDQQRLGLKYEKAKDNVDDSHSKIIELNEKETEEVEETEFHNLCREKRQTKHKWRL